MKMIYRALALSVICVTFTTGAAPSGCFEPGCIFDGETYYDGECLHLSCFVLTCYSNCWTFDKIIDTESCDKCTVYDDPHIITFDNCKYDWFGFCNYSLSQPAVCYPDGTYCTLFAVYGDFARCNKNRASCLDVTTYTIDKNTVVTIYHKTGIPQSLMINGNTFKPLPTNPTAVSDCNGHIYPAIVWQDGTFAYIVGKHFSIIASKNNLVIYTKKENMGRLVGLCGYYSGNKSDDFVPRGECFNTECLETFATSWITEPRNPDCVKARDLQMFNETEEIIENCNKTAFYPICEESVSEGYENCKDEDIETDKETAIESCVKDCCLGDDTCEYWAGIAKEIAASSCKTNAMETE